MEIEQKVKTAVKWSVLGKVASQTVSWGSTFLIFGLLTPDDYGIFAFAVFGSGLFGEINDFGVESAMVQRKNLTRDMIRAAFGFAILMNVLMAACVFFSSYVVADFYGRDELIPMIQLTSIQLLIGALIVVPRSQIVRALDAKKRETVYFIRNLTTAITTLTLAYNGYGVWSILIGELVSTTVAAILFNILSPVHVLPIFSLSKVKPLLSFSFNSVAQNLSVYLLGTLDTMILGYFSATDKVGNYYAGKHLASMPLDKFGLIIKEIALSGLSQIQTDRSNFTYLLMRGVRILSFVMFPVYMGISAVAPELLVFLWGDKWLGMIVPLQLLVISLPLRMILLPLGQAVNAVGQPFVQTVNGLITIALMAVAFTIAIPYGVIGMSLAWVIMFPVTFVITVLRSEKHISIGLFDLVKNFIGPLVSAFLMWGGIYLIRELCGDTFGVGVQLIINILSGVVIYCALSLILARSIFKEVIKFVRG